MKVRIKDIVLVRKSGERIKLSDVVSDIGFEYSLSSSTTTLSSVEEEEELELEVNKK